MEGSDRYTNDIPKVRLDVELLKRNASRELERYKFYQAIIPAYRVQSSIKEVSIQSRRVFAYDDYVQRLRNLSASGHEIPYRVVRNAGIYAYDTLDDYEQIMTKCLRGFNEFEQTGLLAQAVTLINNALDKKNSIDMDALLQQADERIAVIFEEATGIPKELFNRYIDTLREEFKNKHVVGHTAGLRLMYSGSRQGYPLALTETHAKRIITPEQLIEGDIPTITFTKMDNVWTISPYDMLIMLMWSNIYSMRNEVEQINIYGIQRFEGRVWGFIIWGIIALIGIGCGVASLVVEDETAKTVLGIIGVIGINSAFGSGYDSMKTGTSTSPLTAPPGWDCTTSADKRNCKPVE